MFSSLIFIFAVLPLSFAIVGAENENIERRVEQGHSCILPNYPENGSYKIRDSFVLPGEMFPSVTLDISCDTGYINSYSIESIMCVNGHWSGPMPICDQDLTAFDLTKRHRQLESKYLQEVPWHASIYSKSSEGYNEMCGGTLISTTKVISSATCFHDYNNKVRPANNFVVAVNKEFYKYKDSRDSKSQYSDVVDIKVHVRYWGRNKTYSFENNVAIAIVTTPFFLRLSVLPMVLDFDKDRDSTQLTEGNSGKTVGWSWNKVDGESESLSLHAINMQYMKRRDCENILPTYRQPYLTKDKFCMTYVNVTWPLTPDMGNGLFFFDPITERHYLRGIYTDLEIAQDGQTVIIMYTSIVENEAFFVEQL